MPSLKIPSSGLVLKPPNEPSKPEAGGPAAFSLTLADGVIEDMIKCVKSGKIIQVSFGRNPTLLYGSKAQHLLVSNEDPFTTELYRSEFNTSNSNETSQDADNMAPPSHFITRVNKRQLVPTTRKAGARPANVAAEPVDAAIEALKANMSEELSKKKGSGANFIERDPRAPKKGAAKPATNTSRFLSQNRKGFSSSDTTKSMPTSPSLRGVGSPSLAPTSVPLSQRKAEKDKEVRSWILHYLAVDKAKEDEIWDFFSSRTEHTRDEFKTALDKVADYDSSSQAWTLRGNWFKQLDPWVFEYASQEDRQKAIDHAIKAFDKMRLHTSEPEWQKLLPESERGQGKILSKLTAKIAEKSSGAPRGKALRSPGHDTNTETDEDKLLGDSLTVKNGGEAMSRSASSGPATKTKKVSEKEAQAKRLLAKPGKAKAIGKSSPAPKTSPAKKPAAKKDKEDTSRIKSSQFVNESDEEDDYPVPEPAKKNVPSTAAAPKPAAVTKPAAKRARADDNTEARAAQPAVKKARKDDGASTPLLNGNTSKHRISDASQFSQNSQMSQSTAPSTVKSKASSTQKSSPLASSPPTNASDIDEEGPYHTSSSTSPYTSNVNPLKRKAADTTNTRVVKKTVNGNRQHPPPKPASTSSASPASVNGNAGSSSSEVTPEVMEMADQFKAFYSTYVKLHKKLENSAHPTEKEIQDLNAMHSKLETMKAKIFAAVSV